MIDIENNFVLEQVDSLNIGKQFFRALIRDGFSLQPELNNRYSFFLTPYSLSKIESDLMYIKKTLATSDVKSKYLMILLRLYNDVDNDIDIKKIYYKYANDNIILIDATKKIFDKDSGIAYCYKMIEYENSMKDSKSLLYKQKADEIVKKWIDDIKNNELIYYDKKNLDGIKFDNYYNILDNIFKDNKNQYPEYPEQLDIPVELYEKYTIEEYKKCEILENSKFLVYIKKLKEVVNNYINKKIKYNGKVSGVDIVKFLNTPPYGFKYCRLSAYLLRYVLKSYIGSKYYYYDNDICDKFDELYLESFVINSMNKAFKSMPSLSELYLYLPDKNIFKYIDYTKLIFCINNNDIVSIWSLKGTLRNCVEKFKYPIWTIKYLDIDNNIKDLIELYIELINPKFNDDDIYVIDDKKLIDSTICIFDKNLDIIDETRRLVNDKYLEKGMKNFIKNKKEDFDIIMGKTLISDKWKWIWREEKVKEIVNYGKGNC